MALPVVPLHLGPLHPIETALTIALAFGPFLLLGIVVAVRRRQDAREDAEALAASETVEAASAEAQRER